MAKVEELIQSMPPRFQPSSLCSKCGKRRGYKPWGDALAMTHGFMEKRCGVCVYGPQARHAFARAIRLPLLTSKLFWAFLTERRANGG